MEKRLNAKIDAYIAKFKHILVEKIQGGEDFDELVSYIQEYPGFTLEENDFAKRKRSSNSVPLCERCTAKRIDGTQCTRRKQNEKTVFCGTHIKGTPNGIVEASEVKSEMKEKTVCQQEINGIVYYIDDDGYVYSTEDIQSNKLNPKVIARYQVSDGVYTIC